MYSAIILLFLALVNVGAENPGELKHVLVTYRAPEHTPCDYLPDLKVAGQKEADSTLTEKGREAAFAFGKQLADRYQSLKVEDWDKEGWNFGTSTKRTRDAALIFAGGLKGDHEVISKEWTDEDRKKVEYNTTKAFLRFQNPKECPGFFKALATQARAKIKQLIQENKADLVPVVNIYKANPDKPYHFWIAYETLKNMQAVSASRFSKLNKKVKDSLPGLRKFSEGLLYAATSTDDLKRMAGGRLLSNILKDLSKRKSSQPVPNAPNKGNIKGSFFAAPQDLVAAQLAAFNPDGTKYGGEVLTPKTFYPEQGAAHIVELYQKGSKWNVKILYRQNAESKFKEATLPGCSSTVCGLAKVRKALEKFGQTKEKQLQECQAK